MKVRKVKNGIGISITILTCFLIMSGVVIKLNDMYNHINGTIYIKNITNHDNLNTKLEEDFINKDLGENSYYTGLLMYTGMLECATKTVSLDILDTINYINNYLKVLSDKNLLPVDLNIIQDDYSTLSTKVLRYSDRVFSKYESDVLSYSAENIHYSITIDIDMNSKYIYMLKMKLKDGSERLKGYNHHLNQELTKTEFQNYIYSWGEEGNNSEPSELSIVKAIGDNKFELVQNSEIQQTFYATVTMGQDLFEINFSSKKNDN